MPQRSDTRSAARPARAFPPAERVFHLVSADDFERGERAAASRRDDPASGAEPTARTNSLRAGARTVCCDRPVEDVYAVAISRKSVSDVSWCGGAL